ncbi:hypothetical protein RRG08_059764 [Elysia crispata]|uniref:Uncharacterized protein n=1 Tax=Elysia crispata TaxID=231223 RepID=A0AAE1BD23_9GAST|nr:hypothetical protein RRG08_059764 [Elysia crispata]
MYHALSAYSKFRSTGISRTAASSLTPDLKTYSPCLKTNQTRKDAVEEKHKKAHLAVAKLATCRLSVAKAVTLLFLATSRRPSR